MSGPELSIVPAGIGSNDNNQVATFSQQGSVDWVALSRMQFSTSIAILGRLSGAGIEPLTIAVGRAICSYIPLGAYGEKVLVEAMSKLKAFSTIGDVIWFGVGVRHILRELVQTSQGAACVAFCAALTEGHTISTSALIMYELAKVLGSPQELSPSFAQWIALVKVCASVFASTNFGIRVQQYLKLAGYTEGDPCSANISPPNGVGHPRELACAILAIGKVVTGAFQYVEITGGPICCWLAAYTENVLGLRVRLQNASDELLFVNHGIDTNCQVFFKLSDGDILPGSLQCTRQIYRISDGREFVRQSFGGIRNVSQVEATQAADALFLEGRVHWATLFQDTFGQDLNHLLNPTERYNWLRSAVARSNVPSTNLGAAALDLLGYAANYVMAFPESQIYGDCVGFLQAMLDLFPELEVFGEHLLQRCRQLLQDPKADHVLNYRAAKKAVRSLCGCARRNSYCVLRIADLVVILTLIVGRLELESPMLPCRAGIRKLYRDLSSGNDTDDPQNLEAQFIGESLRADLYPRLAAYITLFSCTPIAPRGNHIVSAISDGKVYCYVNTMRGLTDRLQKASRIHVGAGSICVNSRHYDFTCDRPLAVFPNQWLQTPVRELLDISEFFQDTTSPGLRFQAMVEEGARLTFWYQIENKVNHVVVSPVNLIFHLTKALHFKFRYYGRRATVPVDFWKKHTSFVIIGEGIILTGELKERSFLFRPHRGNLLGRIAALYSTLDNPTFRNASLIYNEDDLMRFAEYLSQHEFEQRQRPNQGDWWDHTYSLIS